MHGDPANSLNLPSGPAATIEIAAVQEVHDIVVKVDAVLVLRLPGGGLVWQQLLNNVITKPFTQKLKDCLVNEADVSGCPDVDGSWLATARIVLDDCPGVATKLTVQEVHKLCADPAFWHAPRKNVDQRILV